MSSRLLVASGVALWAGTVLLLAPLRWFRRPPLVERLRPYAPGSLSTPPRPGVFSVASVREVIGPLSTAVGAAIARCFGVTEDLEVRLRRTHSPLDVSAFRARQLGWSVGAAIGAAAAATAAGLGPVAAFLLLGVAPLLTFLALEQRLATASEHRQRRLFLELPVFAEQLAMLIAAGWSLSAALHRLGTRGHGTIARDLRTVTTRTRSGMSAIEALREWAELADVDALSRLVAVLALDRDATDLAGLVSQEARSIRRDVHRELLEAIERKSQQVWIPVTVAALVPGAILIAIPFMHAMRAVANS